MKNLMLFESYTELIQEKKKEKKDLKWIQKAIKKPGALHKILGVPKDEKIPAEKINSKIEELEKKAEGGKKLDKKDRKTLRRLTLAKTLKSL